MLLRGATIKKNSLRNSLIGISSAEKRSCHGLWIVKCCIEPVREWVRQASSSSFIRKFLETCSGKHGLKGAFAQAHSLAGLGWQFINKGWIHSLRALKPAACCHSRLWAAKELKSHITPRTFYQGKGGRERVNKHKEFNCQSRARVCVWLIIIFEVRRRARPRKSIFQHSATVEKTHTIQDEEDQRRRIISF